MRERHLTLASNLATESSEIGDSRPIQACSLHPSGGYLATAGRKMLDAFFNYV